MKSKFILSIAAIGIAIMSCQKSPDTDNLDDNYLVYTNYDAETDFKSINTFHIIDSILIIDKSEKATYWKNSNSQKIVNAYSNELERAGYIPVEENEEADVILQLSYINTTYYFNTYGSGPWWNFYPGYWNWGGWGWYYPYSFTYSYSTGSIIGELVNTNAPAAQNSKLTVIWNSYICGILNGNTLSLTRTLDAIEQAFIQSPYLSNKQ